MRLDRAAQHLCAPASAQHVGVVNAVATGQRRRHQGQQLVSRIRPTRRISQIDVMVHQLAQSQVVAQGDRQDQSGIGHQAVIVEGDVDAVRVLLVSGRFSVSKTIILETGSTLSSLHRANTLIVSMDWG